MTITHQDVATPSPPPKTAASKTSAPRKGRKKRTNPLTARRFFDPVVLALGELTNFTANTAVPMKDVENKILDTFSFTDADRAAVEADRAEKGTDESAEDYLNAFARRRVGFAFRNLRSQSSGNKGTVYRKSSQALTVMMGVGQWSLTEAGVTKARELANLDTSPTTENAETVAAEDTTVPVLEMDTENTEPVEALTDPEPVNVETKSTEETIEDDLPPEPEVKPARRRRTLGTYTG